MVWTSGRRCVTSSTHEPSCSAFCVCGTLIREDHSHTRTMQHVIPAPKASAPATKPCLGILLHHQEVGYALADREHLHRYGVLNIRKLHSPEAKEARFRQSLCHLLDRFPCERIALVLPAESVAGEPLIKSLSAWLEQEARERQLPVRSWDRQVLRGVVVGASRAEATNRILARTLSRRFPQLLRLLPIVRIPIPGHLAPPPTVSKSPMPSAKERYWSSMFLALGAAVATLDQLQWRRLQQEQSH